MARTPKQNPTDDSTRLIRVYADIREMISMIVQVEGGTTADLLDPMIRYHITARYEKHRAKIERIRAAKQELERVKSEARRQVESDAAKARRRRL